MGTEFRLGRREGSGDDGGDGCGAMGMRLVSLSPSLRMAASGGGYFPH